MRGSLLDQDIHEKAPYPSLQVFKNPWLEKLTHVHPIIPLVLWGPVVMYLIWRAFVLHQVNFIQWLGFGFLGLLIWTFIEYTVHRFLFHFPAKGPLGKRLIFIFHGLHHDDPKDPTRLVMPPVPAILMAGALYYLFSFMVPARHLDSFMAWFMVGYLCYDYIHYAIHHFPMRSSAGKYLRKFHLQHHHAPEEVQFGVSSPLWDYVFNTLPKKRTTKA